MTGYGGKPTGILSNRAKYELQVLAVIVAGSIAGGAGGIGVADLIAAKSVRDNPKDPSAGSVGIVVIGTFPIGLIAGGVLGIFATKLLKKPETPRAFEVIPREHGRGSYP